jgi:outer membrane protein assembly factor BamB
MAARRALLVATGSYEDSRWNPLEAPLFDAEALAAVLGDPGIGGYDVATVLDQPAHMIQRAVHRFLTDARLDDELLVYFSCHGMKDYDEQLYFAGSDTAKERELLESEAVPAHFVGRQLNRCRARRKVLLLDCCFSGAFRPDVKGEDPTVDFGIPFAGTGTVVISATDETQLAFEMTEAGTDARLSVFTASIVEGLRTGRADLDGDGCVSAEDLYKYVSAEMSTRDTGQTPKFWVLDGVGSLRIARRIAPGQPPTGEDRARAQSPNAMHQDTDTISAAARPTLYLVPKRIPTSARRQVLSFLGLASAAVAGLGSAYALGRARSNARDEDADDIPRLRWTFSTDDSVRSSPTVADGTVYFGNDDGDLYAVDADTGTERWKFDVGGEVQSSPTAADGTVYVRGVLGDLYAVDADTGHERWVFQNIGGVDSSSSPAVVDGTVYFGSDDGNLYAVAADTGEERWTFAADDSVRSSPAVVDGTVYFGSDDGNLYAVEADTGIERWRFGIGGEVSSSPKVADGTVYVSSGGSLCAVDVGTGTERWILPINDWKLSSPELVNPGVYVSSSRRSVYAVDAETGTERWVFSTDGSIDSSPEVANGMVYFGDCVNHGDGHLYAVDVHTGAEQWRLSISDGVSSSPAIVDRTAYVGGFDGSLHAVAL